MEMATDGPQVESSTGQRANRRRFSPKTSTEIEPNDSKRPLTPLLELLLTGGCELAWRGQTRIHGDGQFPPTVSQPEWRKLP